jgi:hypothetical protein
MPPNINISCLIIATSAASSNKLKTLTTEEVNTYPNNFLVLYVHLVSIL